MSRRIGACPLMLKRMLASTQPEAERSASAGDLFIRFWSRSVAHLARFGPLLQTGVCRVTAYHARHKQGRLLYSLLWYKRSSGTTTDSQGRHPTIRGMRAGEKKE
jgi:hypothetical protein